MRRLGEYDFKKMSDSRIMYLQRPPNFLVIFLVFVIIVLVGLGLWSNVAVKADTVETAGIIVSVDKTPLTLETDGKIAKIHVKEGEYANKGDVLLTLDTGQLKNEMAKYEYLQEYYEERILYIDMFLTEIANEAEKLPEYTPMNPFYNEGRELEFYNLFEDYLRSLEITENYRVLIAEKESSLISEKNSCEVELESNRNTVEQYQLMLKKYEIIAPISGTVHYDYSLLPGTVVSSGTQLGSISSYLGEKKIEMYVDAADRSKINVGDKCYFTIDGLAQTEFGTVDGTIDSISSDATISEDTIYFKTLVSFDSDSVSSKDGDRVNIVNGMKTNVWVIFEEMSYWNYCMETLGLYKLGI